MKDVKSKVVVSVLGSTASILALVSVVGAGTKWQF
jgi:type IV secretory pathway VirB2 component (pilin)